MLQRKQPLYRQVNTRARNVRHNFGGNFRNERAESKTSDETIGSMHGRKNRGLDYTPLFRFLLSKVGHAWDDVFSEAVSRLDKPEPIYWLVAQTVKDKYPYKRVGESTYWSGLYVDDGNRLQQVDPEWTVEKMTPSCGCCTHTFNGVRFTRKYNEAMCVVL